MFNSMADTKPYEDLFSSCLGGDLKQVKHNPKQLVKQKSLIGPASAARHTCNIQRLSHRLVEGLTFNFGAEIV